jgi:hypothetical protein
VDLDPEFWTGPTRPGKIFLDPDLIFLCNKLNLSQVDTGIGTGFELCCGSETVTKVSDPDL